MKFQNLTVFTLLSTSKMRLLKKFSFLFLYPKPRVTYFEPEGDNHYGNALMGSTLGLLLIFISPRIKSLSAVAHGLAGQIRDEILFLSLKISC